MGFSGITVEQRSKEVEALKSFLAYSLIGSLALHIGVLSSGIGNYLTRVPTEEDDAIEFAIVDSPTTEPEKPLEKIPEEPKKLPEVIQKQSIETPPVQKPLQEFIERPKIQPVEQPKQTTQIQPVEQPKQTTQNPQPANTQIAPKPEIPVTTVAPSINQGNQQLRGALSELRDSRTSQNAAGGSAASGVLTGSGSGVGLSTGSGVGSGSGTGTGSGIGSGSGSGVGNERVKRPPVATAPTPPKINTSGNGDGRAACRECNAKYPEAARRRGVEGRVEVAVDTDAQGNVTNVRIARSSGNRDLDEETMRQARNWKLKPAEGGRQGVSIGTEFAIKGSRRSRQVQERQAQRQAEERTRQTTAANSTEEAPKRRRREMIPASNEATATKTKPAISGFSRRLEPQRGESTPTNSSSRARTTPTQGTARESLRSIQRERTATDSSPKPQPTANRRRRRRPDNASQNKLRESLRGLRQQPQSQPAAPNQE
ncbi:MAG: TonB family protein [Nostoc sp. C3-bin3]|nr:TonB family protein [Nostoc sp. C3-bin3]